MGELPTFHNDATKFRQLFLNLLSNATKFTKSGNIEVSAEPRGRVVAFTVSDNGIGMSKEQQKRSSKPSFRRTIPPAGITVAPASAWPSARNTANSWGGRSRWKSSVGAGTTFYIKLPNRGPAQGQVAQPGNGLLAAL